MLVYSSIVSKFVFKLFHYFITHLYFFCKYLLMLFIVIYYYQIETDFIIITIHTDLVARSSLTVLKVPSSNPSWGTDVCPRCFQCFFCTTRYFDFFDVINFFRPYISIYRVMMKNLHIFHKSEFLLFRNTLKCKALFSLLMTNTVFQI